MAGGEKMGMCLPFLGRGAKAEREHIVIFSLSSSFVCLKYQYVYTQRQIRLPWIGNARK
jgi:hypothetical protein